MAKYVNLSFTRVSLSAGIGADVAETELSAIASSPRHVFTADNSSSLLAISAKLEAMFCLCK